MKFRAHDTFFIRKGWQSKGMRHLYAPYFEERGTLGLLQYRLASNRDLATAWYFFFNEFSMQEFTRNNFVTALKKYIGKNSAGSRQEIALNELLRAPRNIGRVFNLDSITILDALYKI